MAVIFVAHPYAGNVAHNISEMRQICYKITEDGDTPICPAIYCTQFLSDADEEQRQLGFFIGATMMKFCDVLRVYGMSPGVRDEIKMARQLGKVIEYANDTEDSSPLD